MTMDVDDKYKDCHNSTLKSYGAPLFPKILKEEDGCVLLRVTISGREFGFNIGWVPAENLDWFVSVVCSQLNEAYVLGRRDAKLDAQKAAKGLMELLGL